MDRLQTSRDGWGRANALTIGTIDGGGTGSELISCVRRVLDGLTKVSGQDFELVRFGDERWADAVENEVYDSGLHHDLRAFYEDIRERNGVIVRGSLPAPVLYRLRRDLGQAAKWVPLNPFPLVSRYPDFQIHLVREGVHGIYHADEVRRDGDVVRAEMTWAADALRFVARESFRLARGTCRPRVTTVLKTSVMGQIGNLWLEAFADESRNHPDVDLQHRPSGAGFSDMWAAPRGFGVIATDDQSGDILADLLPTILYGSRNLVAAGNFSAAGHASFQTDHGTVKPLVGQDAVNPVAMIAALAMALDYGLPEDRLGAALRVAIEEVLRAGFRTKDFVSNPDQRVVGTYEMTERIIEQVTLMLDRPSRASSV